MGFRVYLLAVLGKAPSAVQREMNLTATDDFEDTPDWPVCGTTLPNDVYLLYINDGVVPEHNRLAAISKSASLLTCQVNETVMVSQASSWVEGQEEWCVTHDAQLGIQHLEVRGRLPDQFSAIRDRLLELQQSANDCDYVFDVPVELFAAMGGIRYDVDIDETGHDAWQVLARSQKSALSGFRRWWPFR